MVAAAVAAAAGAEAASSTSHPAHTLLARAHSPSSAARIFADKIQHKPLLLKPTTDGDKRALRRHVRLRQKQYYLQHQKPKPLSAREKRATGVHQLKRDEVRYALYQGLNELWNGYMLEVLGFTDPAGQLRPGWEGKRVTSEGVGSLLASADLHGAEIEVVQSRDTGRVGTRGIVVRDTKFSFVVVTPAEKVRTLPKKGSVFRYVTRVMVDGQERRRLVFEVNGSQFELRPVDRANRKFKWQNGSEYV
ncbi:hypothetical protein DV738_g4688, partial [Chaetothyriales sp. CBS 135597]